MRTVKLFILSLPLQSFAQAPYRISSNIVNLSEPKRIYLAPGLVSLIEFPQNIIEVRVGNPKSVKAIISQNSPKELTVYLSSSASIPTNIIVRAEKRVFVFDIVPSRSNHQDYVKVQGAYGAPASSSKSGVIEVVKLEHKNEPRALNKLKVLESKRLGL